MTLVQEEAERHKIVRYLGFARMIRSIGTGSIWPFIALYFSLDLQLPLYIIGMIFSVYFAIGIILQPVSGLLADFLGRKPTMIFASMIYIAVSLALFLADVLHGSAILISALFVSFALPSALEYPAINAMVSDLSPETGKSREFSTFRTIFNIGWIIGPLFGVFFFELSFSLIFLLNVTTSVVSLLFILIFIDDRNSFRRQEGRQMHDHHFKLDRLIIIFGSGVFFLSVLAGQFQTSLPLFSAHSILSNPALYGYVYAVNGMTVVVTQPVINRLVRRFSDMQSMVIGVLFYIIGYGSVAFASSLPQLVLDMVIITTGENLTAPAENSVISSYSSQERTGRYMAFKSAMWGMGSMIGPSAGLLFLYGFGYSGFLTWFSISLFGVAAIAAFLLFASGMKRQVKHIHVNLKVHEDF
ncbi:MAG: MDR family MFS transporter [Thermoplasmataceae archaeon]